MTQDHVADKLFNAALSSLKRGVPLQAIALLEQYNVQQATNPHAWFLLGAARDQSGQPELAAEAFAEAERLAPAHPQATNALAAMLVRLERLPDAIAAFERALTLNPGDPQIRTNIGITSEKLGREKEAMTAYDAALYLDPNHLGGLSNRGNLFLKQGRPEKAIQDHLHFVKCAPADPIGFYNCAETYAVMFQDEEALQACEETLQRDPLHIKALFTKGIVLSSLNRFQEALLTFSQARQVDQKTFGELVSKAAANIGTAAEPDPANIYCLRNLARLKICRWDRYESFVASMELQIELWEKAPENGMPDRAIAHAALALPLLPESHLALSRATANAIRLQFQQTINQHVLDKPIDAGSAKSSRLDANLEQTRKIRIGYVSPDFRYHALSHLTRNMFAMHDRNEFIIHGYSLVADPTNPLRHEIAAGCDFFHDVADLSTLELDSLLRKDQIDIVVDLSGYTAYARPELFLLKPAPIGVSYLGYAGSLGEPAIDYVITDQIAGGSELESQFLENIIALPGTCYPYSQHQQIAEPGTRAFYGLPAKGFVFCCFNNSWKIDPGTFDIWMRLLARVEDSVFWLYRPTPAVEANLRSEARKRGIDPSRLVFADPIPVDQHLARYRIADLYLDTFYYGSHTTGLDVLRAGLPMIVRPGATYASRISTSHVSVLGMQELVTDSEATYEELAFSLANDPIRLKQLRDRVALLRVSSPLFNTAGLVKNLESAYRTIWQRHVADQPSAPLKL